MNNSTEDSDDVTNGEEELEEIEECIERKGRGKRNVSEWKREKRKRLRIAGKEYVNSKGDLTRSRQIGADCKCRRKCYIKVNSEERERLFENYYSLQSHDEQNAYLFQLIRRQEIARKRSKESGRRTCTFKYFVHLNDGKEIHICRQAFCHIHAISAHKVRLLCEKLDRKVSYPRDERGRHSNRPTRIPEGIITTVKKHILDILQSERLCDFVKDDKQAKNQSGVDLNITKMWRDFLIEHGKTLGNDNGEREVDIEDEWSGTCVKLWLYNKVFHSVVSKEMSDLLSKKIDGIRNDRGGETKSKTASREAGKVPLPRNLAATGRVGLGSSQAEMQNLLGVRPVHSSDQGSFSFYGVINNAQYHR